MNYNRLASSEMIVKLNELIPYVCWNSDWHTIVSTKKVIIVVILYPPSSPKIWGCTKSLRVEGVNYCFQQMSRAESRPSVLNSILGGKETRFWHNAVFCCSEATILLFMSHLSLMGQLCLFDNQKRDQIQNYL